MLEHFFFNKHILLSFLHGTVITIQVTFFAFFCSIMLGAIISIFRASNIWGVRFIAHAYLGIFRSVPELLIIFAIYFSSDQIVYAIGQLFGATWHITTSPMSAGIIALTIVHASYMSEVFRSAWQSIPKGAIEAAYAIGMSRRQIFFRIILKQIRYYCIYGMGNVLMVLVKDSSLLSIIGVSELMREAKITISVQKEPFTIYAVVTIIYLVITLIIAHLIKWYKRKNNFVFQERDQDIVHVF